jgi:DNA-binding NarL/FixJ family response regulator
MIRIVIVDGQDSDRNNAELVLSGQRDFAVVGTGRDGYDAFKLVESSKPDILLLDINLSYIDGLKASSILKCQFPRMGVIILTRLDNDKHVIYAMSNGVSGYLLKNRDMEHLAGIIRVIHEGGSLLSPHIAARLFPQVSQIAWGKRPLPKDLPFPPHLSRTEVKIINLVGRGLENQEIAEKLRLKIGTVRNHISVILQKTSLKNRTQLAVLAAEYGLTWKTLDAPAAKEPPERLGGRALQA